MKDGKARSGLSVKSNLRTSLSRLLKIGDQYLYDAMQAAQMKVLKESKDANNQTLEIEALKEMISTDLADPDKFIKTLPTKQNKILLVNGLAGFPTTPPPYWPRPIAYSVMDVIAENLQKILLSADQGGAQEALAISLSHSLGVRNIPTPTVPGAEVVFKVGNTDYKTNQFAVFHAYYQMDNPEVMKHVADSNFTPPAISDLKIPSNKRTKPDSKSNLKVYALLILKVEGWRIANKFKELFSGDTAQLLDASQKAVPLMTLFAGVEDYSQNKYKYTVNEGERVFILELLRRSLQDLNVKSGSTNTAFAGVASGMTPSELKKIIKDICENTEATENEVLTFLTFKVNYDALRSAIQTTTMTQTDVTDIENGVNIATAQASLVYKNYVLTNSLPTKRGQPISAADKTRLNDLVKKLQDEMMKGDVGLQYISDEVKERIIAPGVNMTLNKIQITIDESSESNFAKITDIMVDINEVTEEALGLLDRHESVSFGQYRPKRDFDNPASDMQRQALADEIDKITEFVRARNPDYQLLRLKIDGIINRLTDFGVTLDHGINMFQAQGQGQFNITRSSYSSTTAMKRATVRLIDLLGDVRMVIQSPPRSARTLGLAIPQNRFNQMRSTFFEDVQRFGTRYFPKGYYKSIDLCIQMVEKLSPVPKRHNRQFPKL